MIKVCPLLPQFKVSDSGDVFTDRGIRRPSINKKGYRNIVFYVSGGRLTPVIKSIGVHRIVWETFKGPIPDGMVIRHIDNNPANNNLTNLAIGTHQDNNNDRMKAGHYYNGEQHHGAKLTNDQANEIRSLRSQKVKVKTLAIKFNVSVSTIESIIYNKAYITTKVLSLTGRP